MQDIISAIVVDTHKKSYVEEPELLDKTNLTSEQIAEYSGESKEIKPVTVATYQVL